MSYYMLNFVEKLISFMFSSIINSIQNVNMSELNKSHKVTLDYILNTKQFDIIYFFTNKNHTLFLSVFLILSSIVLIILHFITDI